MRRPPEHDDVIAGAVAEADRRRDRSDRDLRTTVAHFRATVGPVCTAWDLTARAWFDGGAGAPTLDVVRVDGTGAVLKIADPGALDRAATVMLAAEGRGYAEVLAWDEAAGALLTERLGADLWTEHRTVSAQVEVVAPLLLEAWQVPAGSGKPFEGKAAGLVAILDDLGPRYGGGHEGALALASAHARELATTERPEVVCHGDPHGGNVLRRGTGWALIDPDGFVGERAYDLGVALRDACHELRDLEEAEPGSGTDLLRQGCEHAAELAGVEAERVWRWAYVERVTTGLYLAWHGYPEEARTFLDTASTIAAGG